ncbi:chemotaxis protein CheW [Radiobacillus deserti]|uniref:CheW-like domain-containing protein n=1 Tax=Radiobacillus deserti TaxID=2594883 RepID=A0A516KCQ6_9BACI|nr:chemotaxis protein CheW [Radiobacillus deserti]QDP39193.1 hypothetical protein FN924_02675 [Radiobacillus deserti]
MEQQVIIKINEVEFGIPVSQVISIEKTVELTPIPNTPSYMLGIVDIREQVLPVLDLNMLLFNKQVNQDDNTRLIIVKSVHQTIVLMVEEAKEITVIYEEDIQSLQNQSLKQSFIAGLAKVNEKLISLLNVDDLMGNLTSMDLIQDYVRQSIHGQNESSKQQN